MCTVYKDQLFISEFIEIYRSFPCLWKKNDSQYHNTNERDAAYKVLLEKYKEYEPTATIDTVKNKINNLRTVYNKELRKVQQFESKGEIHTPTLWYYDLMSFLDHQLVQRRNNNNNNNNSSNLIEKYETENTDDSNSFLENELKKEDPIEPAFNNNNNNESTIYQQEFTTHLNNENRKRTNLQQLNTVRNKRSSDCTTVDRFDTTTTTTTLENRYAAFGSYISHELNQIPSDMVPFVKKLINEAIFEGHMRSLNRTSTIRTQPY